jgi:hypothetical protein
MISLISLVALCTAIAEVASRPAWQMDYQAAQLQSARLHKPLAIFLAPGKDGWHQLSQSGKLSREVQTLIGAKYVPVFLNTETVDGKALASSFEISKGIGLVLSDHEGQLQAFRHEGNLSQKHLVRALQRHADPDRPVRTTETNVEPVRRATVSASVVPVSYDPAYRLLEGAAPTCST